MNANGFSDSECLFDENIRSQLRAWGKTPLTEEFVSNLGHPSNLDTIQGRNIKKKSTTDWESPSVSDDRAASKKRSPIDSDADLPHKRNCTSSPLSRDVDSEDGDQDEDEEWVSRILDLPLSEIFC